MRGNKFSLMGLIKFESLSDKRFHFVNFTTNTKIMSECFKQQCYAHRFDKEGLFV